MRVPALIAALLWATVSQAQTAQVTAELASDTATPGQEVILRITVLVPTFLSAPPTFPDLEQPNLRVTLPEGASGPTSASIGGDTWSGVSRAYSLTALAPGDYTIGPLEVAVTTSDPATGSPLTRTVAAPAVALSVSVPDGAEGLDPFVAGQALRLSRDVSGATEGLDPGDSVTVTVTATLTGGPAMLLPPIMPATAPSGFAAYPDAPVVSDASDRGVTTGTRIESVTYVAEGGGGGSLPEVSLDWFDLGAGTVATAKLDAVPFSATGPPPAGAAPRQRDLARRAVPFVLVAAVLAALALAARWLWPRVAAWRATRAAAHAASEAGAWEALTARIGARDLGGTLAARSVWAARLVPAPDLTQADAALRDVGAARYGGGFSHEDWSRVATAFAVARSTTGGARNDPAGLTALNPRPSALQP